MPSHHLRAELPDFIWPEVVQCETLHILTPPSTKVQRICLVLSRELKLYAFRRKQLLASISLEHTVLARVAARLQKTPAPVPLQKATSSSSSKGRSELERTISTEKHNPSINSSRKCEVSLGKYIYCGLTRQHASIYILVQCWDKLMVLQYQQARLKLDDDDQENKGGVEADLPRFVPIDEYEHVKSYKLVHGKLPYSALLEIKSENGIIRTDFQKSSNNTTLPHPEETNCFRSDRQDDFQQLLERVQLARQELDRHTIRTGEVFERLQNRLTFGMPHIRSLRLDEKQMLVRCGDVWHRLTPNGHLVLGVPLANQCITPNLTVIRNLRPIILPIHDGRHQLHVAVHSQYRLYHFQETFGNLESVETFMATMGQEEETTENTLGKHWISDNSESSLQLLPESFAVLVIKISLKELISLRHKFLLMLHYEVFREKICNETVYGHLTDTDTVHPLQMLIRVMDLQQSWHDDTKRQQLSIVFRPETIHQDFLAIAMSSLETRLQIIFVNDVSSVLFAQNLQMYFDMQRCPLNRQESAGVSTTNLDGTMMQDNSDDSRLIFFNSKRNSLWFGCLAIRLSQSRPERNYLQKLNPCKGEELWKFYHPSDDIRLLFVQLLKDELFCKSCNVKVLEESDKEEKKEEEGLKDKPSYHTSKKDKSSRKIQLLKKVEHLLRQELQMLSEMVVALKKDSSLRDSSVWLEKWEQYARLQMKTDLILNDDVAEN